MKKCLEPVTGNVYNENVVRKTISAKKSKNTE